MPKLSSFGADNTPTTDDAVPTIDTTTGKNRKVTIANLITLLLANVPTGNQSPVTRWDESFFDYVASGGVWTADSVGVNRNASMTAMICYINGRRISIAAVTGRTFTASADTYIDVLDNLDGTGTLVYTPTASNNLASVALAANSLRIGIIVTGATTIATTASINQGQEDRLLPIASSIPYAVTDSLGNLICNRSPNPLMLGFRRIIANFTTTTTPTIVDVPGLSMPIIVPNGKRIKLSAYCGNFNTSGAAGTDLNISIREGSTYLGTTIIDQNVAGFNMIGYVEAPITPSAGLHTYIVSVAQNAAGTLTVGANSAPSATVPGPAFIKAELVN